MADERIEIDVQKALQGIAKLSSGLDGLQSKVKSTGTAIDNAFDQGFAVGVSDALNDLQKEYDQLKKSADTLKNALKTATDPTAVKLYAQNIAVLEAGMKKLETAGKAAGVQLKEANKSAGTGKQVFENFFGAFTKATIIIAAIEAVVAFTKYAVGLSENINRAKKSFEAFTGSAAEADKIVNELVATAGKNFLPTGDVLDAGKALVSFGENARDLPDILGRIADVSAATGKNFNELTTIYGKARESGVLYAEDINQLVDAGIPIVQEFAKQMGVSEEQVKKLASEGKISFEELQLAMFNLTKEGGKFADQAQIQADSIAGAWARLVAVIDPVVSAVGDFFSSFFKDVIDGARITAEAIAGAFSDTPKIEVDYTGRDAYEQAKDDLYEQQRLEKAADKARRDRNKKTSEELAKIERERQKLILDAMKEGEDKEIAQENFRFSELTKALKKYHIDTTEAEEQHQINLVKIGVKYANERLNAELELIDMRRAQGEYEAQLLSDSVERTKASAASAQAVRESEIALLEAYFDNFIAAMESNGASKEAVAAQQLEFDNRIKSERLQNEIKFQEALLSTINAGDTAAIEQAKNNIAKLKAQLEGLSIPAPADKPGGKKGGLLSQLGFDDDQIKELEKAVGTITGLFEDLAAAQVAEADARLSTAKATTDAAQQYYDEQKKIADDGFASDLDLAARQLAAAKANEDKALEQKKKAQRQQLLLETALQAANLATAASQTLRTFNGPLLPVGIALVATMIGAFIAAKAKALKATKFRQGGQGYVDGSGIIVGESHERGGVQFEAEGGEFMGTDGKRFGIVNKRMTAKHFDLLQAINTDNRAKMRKALEGLTAPMDRGAVAGAAGGSVTIVSTGGKDQETYNLLKEWRADGKKQKTVTVAGGYMITTTGNLTKRVKIK